MEHQENITKDNAIYVKMLGRFSMEYHGKSLLGKSTGGTQFSYLMQAMIHDKKTGIDREQLEELLFEDRDIENIHHALQCVVYNANRQLVKLGLPKAKYIIQKDGIFYWNQEIQMIEDTVLFEKNYQIAYQQKSKEKRLEYFLKACHYYSGEFLAASAGIIWVASEAKRYRELFSCCVTEASCILLENQEYEKLQELGEYAAKKDPFAEWEYLIIEGMVGLGKYQEANQVYESTVEYYRKERGRFPSQKLDEALIHSPQIFDEIWKELGETKVLPKAYLCNYSVFQGIYQMLNRLVKRGRFCFCLMLCTIVDCKGNSMKEGVVLTQLSQRFEEVISQNLRCSDTVCKYGNGQYLVMLMNLTGEEGVQIQKRINQKFLTAKQKTGVQYFIREVNGNSPQN